MIEDMIVIENHHDNMNSVVYANHIMVGGCFFHKSELNNFCKENDLSEHKKKQILDAIKGKGSYKQVKEVPMFIYYYCSSVGVMSVEFKKELIKYKDSHVAFLYCLNIRNDKDIRQIIIDNNDRYNAERYYFFVSPDDDMKKIFDIY